MNVVVEIAGRKALPVWTIPYATGHLPSADELLGMLSDPDYSDGFYSIFPSAFNLDENGEPCILPPGQWADLARQIEKLHLDLKDKKQTRLDDDQEWRKRSIELIMPSKAYVWLDEFEKWFNDYIKKKQENFRIDLCLTPILPNSHDEYFQESAKRLRQLQNPIRFDDFALTEAQDYTLNDELPLWDIARNWAYETRQMPSAILKKLAHSSWEWINIAQLAEEEHARPNAEELHQLKAAYQKANHDFLVIHFDAKKA